MKRQVIAAFLLTAAAAASATYCDDGSTWESHPGGICPPKNSQPTGGNPVYNGGGGGGGGAGVGVGVGVSKARATGGRATANGGKAVSRGGDQQQQQLQQQQLRGEVKSANTLESNGNGMNGDVNVSVGAGGGNTSNRSSFIAPPPIIHGAGVGPLPAGAMLQFYRPCGSLQMKISRVVEGRETNTGSQATPYEHTWTDVVLDATDGNGTPTPVFYDKENRPWGSEYYIVTQQVAVGIEGAISGQLFGSRGGVGAGVNSGVAITVPVQRVILSLCPLWSNKVETPAPPLPVVVVKWKTKTVYKDRPPCCIPPPPPCCMYQQTPILGTK